MAEKPGVGHTGLAHSGCRRSSRMGMCLRPSEDATSLRRIRMITSAFGVLLARRCATAAASLSLSLAFLWDPFFFFASHRVTVKKRGAHTRGCTRPRISTNPPLSPSLCVCIALRDCVCVCGVLCWIGFSFSPCLPTLRLFHVPPPICACETPLCRCISVIVCCSANTTSHHTTLCLPAFSVS